MSDTFLVFDLLVKLDESFYPSSPVYQKCAPSPIVKGILNENSEPLFISLF